MDSNTYSSGWPGGLDLLAAAVDELAAEDLDALPDAEAAQRVLVLRGLLERLEGQWLRELAGVDGRGAAGADQDVPAEATAAWLRHRTRMGHTDAHQRVRVARALHRGPLAGAAQALADGDISYPHAAALTRATQELPAATVAAAEPVLVQAARRLDPPRLRKVIGHLCEVADPDAADTRAQRNADALTELARRQLEGGRLPKTGGVRPQVTVTIELASLLGQAGLPGGEGGWVGPLPAETARRLACDAAVTRVLVTRHQPVGDGDHHPASQGDDGDPAGNLAARLRAALVLLPPVLGGARAEPLEVGRATRVIAPAQRTALTVRDGGCRFPGCDRPVAWCEGHHLRHWLHGGPTDLGNLVLLCRGHHHAVHEGGWRLDRHPDGTITAIPPHRRRTTAA
jgi:Domain of unknown function (DUF222)/HNH endonuclease